MQWDCTNYSCPCPTMLREPNGERAYICQMITDGNLMETEVFQPVRGYTTIHRTFCVGHSSRLQHKQGIRVRQGCRGIVLNVRFLAIYLSSAYKETPQDVPITAIRNGRMTDGAAFSVTLPHSEQSLTLA